MRDGYFHEMKLPTKIGIGVIHGDMTYKQAMTWGKKNMPDDLKRAGFVVSVVEVRRDMMDDIPSWRRINYSK